MQKKLSLFDLISIGVGCIVGSGIFALLGVGIAFTGYVPVRPAINLPSNAYKHF